MANYSVGTSDPPLRPDPGAGPWNSKPTEAGTFLKKQAVIQILPHAYLIIGDDATKHMYHYMGNSGSTYTIDLEDMISDVPSAKANFNREMEEAKKFVETLGLGVHNITSTSINRPLYNNKSESWNWYFAIGGYSAWGKGVATIIDSGKIRNYYLQFEYKFFDRYNWDGGKSVTILGITITDREMGEFHRQGMAREFDCVGSITRSINWTGIAPSKPAPSPTPVVPTPPGPVGPKIHIVSKGESLSSIARIYYGDMAKWSKIYAANKATIGSNPNLIHPGQKLVIP